MIGDTEFEKAQMGEKVLHDMLRLQAREKSISESGEVCSEPKPASYVELFPKIVNRFKVFAIFSKMFLDV